VEPLTLMRRDLEYDYETETERIEESDRGITVAPGDWQDSTLRMDGHCCGCTWHFHRDQVESLRDYLTEMLGHGESDDLGR
jgi:hypothetical protein